MTVIYPKSFHSSPAANFDGVFDWDYLLPAFEGSKIQPMDFDGVVERNGKILIFETKDMGRSIPLGQSITLETMIRKDKGDTTVFVIYGKSAPEVSAMEEWFYREGIGVKKLSTSCDADYVLKLTNAWYRIANERRT